MALPVREIPKSSVTLGQDTIEFRSLTMKEADAFTKHEGDTLAQAIFIVSCALSVSEDDASTWLDSVSFGETQALINAVLDLSGLREDKDEPDPKPDGSEPS